MLTSVPFSYFAPSDIANNIRSDDITIEVIFFGEGVDNRNMSINKEASALAENAKPKL
jgi:pyruvate dehydrogenase phosphatase